MQLREQRVARGDSDDDVSRTLEELLGRMGQQLALLEAALAESRGHFDAGREAAEAELRGARLLGELTAGLSGGVARP